MIEPWYVQIRHKNGGFLKRVGYFDRVESWAIMDDAREGGFMVREDAEWLMETRQAPIAYDQLSIVPAIGCGCCGMYDPDIREVGWGVFRCDKHLARNPCCIRGCGRTFAHRVDENYDHDVMCSHHWRQAPKRWRDLAALIRRRAKRRGWCDRLARQHNWIWQRCRRFVDGGEHIDMERINAMFGWVE